MIACRRGAGAEDRRDGHSVRQVEEWGPAGKENGKAPPPPLGKLRGASKDADTSRSSGASPMRSGSKSPSTIVARPAWCTSDIAASISLTRSCGGWRARAEAAAAANREPTMDTTARPVSQSMSLVGHSSRLSGYRYTPAEPLLASVPMALTPA